MTTSYWLAETKRAARAAAHVRPGGRDRGRRRRHGLLVRTRARRPRAACPRARGPRGRGRRERAERRLRPPRRRHELRPCPREHGRGARPAALAALRARTRRDGGARGRRASSRGQPPPRRRRGRAVGARGRARGASRGRLRGRMARPAPGAARPAVPRRAPPPPRRRDSPCALGAPPRRAAVRAGAEIVEGSRVELEALDADASWSPTTA